MQPVIEPAAVADLAQLEPRLGEWLLAEHKLSPADLERALGVQRTMGGRLGRLLVDLGRGIARPDSQAQRSKGEKGETSHEPDPPSH